MKDVVLPGGTRFDVIDGALIITLAADDLIVCSECPNIRAQLLERGTPERIRLLAFGLLHLAEHVEAER